MHTPFSDSTLILLFQSKQTVEFDECVGQTLEACQEIIQAEVLANPGVFEYRTQLEVDVMNVRTSDAPNYNQVGLRTNLNETGVVGVLGDGMIFYPWDWCIYGMYYNNIFCFLRSVWMRSFLDYSFVVDIR